MEHFECDERVSFRLRHCEPQRFAVDLERDGHADLHGYRERSGRLEHLFSDGDRLLESGAGYADLYSHLRTGWRLQLRLRLQLREHRHPALMELYERKLGIH